MFAVKVETRFLGPKRPSFGVKPWLLMDLKTWFLKTGFSPRVITQ
jgi:hypothetical protein